MRRAAADCGLFKSINSLGSLWKYIRYSLIMILSVFLAPLIGDAFDGDVEKDLQSTLERSRTTVVALKKKNQSGSPVAREIRQLTTLSEDIRACNLLLEERFKLREEKTKIHGKAALGRHHAMIEGYRKALADYLGLVESIPHDGAISPTTIDALEALLDSLLPKKKHPLIGTLPYKHLNYPAQEPNTAPTITPAYKGGDTTVNPDDTLGTPEAPISKEIATLAQSLNWSPVSIYEYIKNNVDTEWYWGCMKGAEDTLRQKSGNDCDQATLLTALLRASGFPTRYIRGSIEFFPDIARAKNLTGIDDPQTLAECFQKAGIPYKLVIQGGKITNIQVEHIWVESQIPYANYRGIVIDEYGKTWLGLDTSIKVEDYVYNDPKDVLTLPAISERLAGIRDEYLGLTSQPSNTPSATPLEYLQSRISDALTTQISQLTYADFPRTRTLPPDIMKILPDSLQFEQRKITHEYTSIPDELVHKTRFTATDMNNNELFSVTLPVYRLSNQQIAIIYEPETVEDQEIINSYGGLDNTPAYLIRLRPVLTVNNNRIVVARDGLPMGGEFNLAIDLISPNGTQSIVNGSIVGNLSVVGISAQRAVLAPSPLAGEGGGEGAKDAERLLYESAQHYIDRWNQAEDELASLLHLSLSRPLPTIVTIGGVIDVSYLLDTPHGFTWKGVFIDAGFRTIEAVHQTQDPDNRTRLFMQLSSLQGSILENRIFEDDFKVESISTAKLFQLATRNSQSAADIIAIDKTNIDAVLPTLSFDDNLKEDITNAVNQNFAIRIPQSEMNYQDWSGIGYIKENPDTGESGWMLSGMIAGGMTAWDIEKWNAAIAGTLSNPYSEPANYDPASAQYIEKLLATDMRDGTVGTKLSQPLQVRVLDAKKKPVKNIQVTFTIKAGGGTFGNDFANIIKTTTATTNAKGIASASPMLGRYTKDNPTFVWNEGSTYDQQAGENIIDAALPSGTNLIMPFTALGMPDKDSVHMIPVHGDGWWSSVLSFVGFISVSVEDKYANAVSNVPVVFTSMKITDLSCTTDKEKNYASLVPTDAACLKQAPVWGDCGDPVSTLTITSSYTGAAVEVILGGVPNATYSIIATAGTSTTFNLHTYEFGNCAGNDEPSNTLMMMSVELNDQYGNTINAGKSGSTIPVSAKMYSVREGEMTINETLSCGAGPLTCRRIVGDTTYETRTDFSSASMTFGDTEGTTQGNSGVYKADYKLQPGKNTVAIKAEVTINRNKSQNSCSGCNTNPEYIHWDAITGHMTVYGVTVKTQPIPMLLVNSDGYLSTDQTITYAIEPLDSDYNAMSAYAFIYKDNNIVAQIPTETKGIGTATLNRGFQFDLNSKYEVEVILNYGTGVEIKSDRVTIPVAQVMVMTDESTPTTADEIKFSDGSKGSNGTKKYHIEIKSQSWLSSCATLTGRIVTLSTATATAGQPVIPPQNTGDVYTAEYSLAFNHPLLPIGNKLCNVQIVDNLDNGSHKDKFVLSNRPRTALDVGLPYSNIYNTAVLYGGLGNIFWLEVAGVGKALPIEPVGVVVLGIDGLRQDVLYKHSEDSTNEASYDDPNGCGTGNRCYVELSQLKGLCAVMGGKYTETLGISSCDPAGAENNHIKMKDITAIFPSITFASWASIFTGKMPKDTGILGNEFFARDLVYTDPMTGQNFWKWTIWGLNMGNETTYPAGMVTLDADGGAFSPGGAKFALRNVIPAEFSILGYGGEATTLSQKIIVSAPNAVLTADPLWSDINTLVDMKYAISPRNEFGITTGRCDQSEYECGTAAIFNQYARGADWWGTASNEWSSAFYAALSQLSLHGEAALLDESSAGEAEKFIKGYFSKKKKDGNRKRFPSLFSVYLPGLDHEAHLKGMGQYVDFFKNKTDANVKVIVDALKGKDEFDNKIFIIVADHGHTAMPTDLTYEDEQWSDENISPEPMIVDVPIDMSCSLKTDMLNHDTRESELHNNNLHIWELANLFTQFPSTASSVTLRILAPKEIAGIKGIAASPNLDQANIVAAMNGPIAHIYIKGMDWQSDPDPQVLNLVLNRLYFNLKIGFSATGLKRELLNRYFPKLMHSIDEILVRKRTQTPTGIEDTYEIVTSIFEDASGNLNIVKAAPNSSIGEVDAINRINKMNSFNRSGDIVLIMRDASTGNVSDRFTTSYACKSWHGSLNSSDSYVPLILSYPGGNKSELSAITDVVCTNNSCNGNWSMPELIKGIINKQY